MGSTTQLELLRSFPLLHLFCGFVKYEVEGDDGVWMRTYGAHEFELRMLQDEHEHAVVDCVRGDHLVTG